MPFTCLPSYWRMFGLGVSGVGFSVLGLGCRVQELLFFRACRPIGAVGGGGLSVHDFWFVGRDSRVGGWGWGFWD